MATKHFLSPTPKNNIGWLIDAINFLFPHVQKLIKGTLSGFSHSLLPKRQEFYLPLSKESYLFLISELL
jgi:hypothetical protein